MHRGPGDARGRHGARRPYPRATSWVPTGAMMVRGHQHARAVHHRHRPVLLARPLSVRAPLPSVSLDGLLSQIRYGDSSAHSVPPDTGMAATAR